MTEFSQLLADLLRRGVQWDAAIAQAAQRAGMQSVTIKDIQAAVGANPNAFPPAYKRLR